MGRGVRSASDCRRSDSPDNADTCRDLARAAYQISFALTRRHAIGRAARSARNEMVNAKETRESEMLSSEKVEITTDQVWCALEDVRDPEIPVVSVVEMGI